STRARLRGEFIRQAKERRRDYTVDWVHLKLNDQAQRTVLCKDPFLAFDDRVEKLIASMGATARPRPACRTGRPGAPAPAACGGGRGAGGPGRPAAARPPRPSAPGPPGSVW